MKVKFAGECLLDLNRYDLYNTYKDLFKWPKDRNKLVEWGIGSVNLRKLRSGKNPSPDGFWQRQQLQTLLGSSTAYGKKYVIPLDFEAVTNHGAFYPRVLGSEMQFEVTLADTTNILQQDSMRLRPQWQRSSLQHDQHRAAV